MLAYVIPTRNRPERLAQTLHALGALPFHAAKVIVADNAAPSLHPSVEAPAVLANGLGVSVLRMGRNLGTAARNAAVRAADRSCEWIVMLDDDSHPAPADLGFLRALAEARPDTAAVQAEIHLPGQGKRESGGLPEVFVGCGVAIRRRAFLEVGGYDESFDYYAEEYDLSAKLLLAGWRITLDRRFRVVHHKVEQGRDMNRILRRLVRNNGWVMQRYSPDAVRRAEVREVVSRYGKIARKEGALPGYLRGLGELGATLARQKRRPMPGELFDRFTGLAAAREALREAHDREPFGRAVLVAEGKNARVVRVALRELGVEVVASTRHRPETGATSMVIGTLSPGPMLDAYERLRRENPEARVIAPWPGLIGGEREGSRYSTAA